jgi:hypothetical protein
LRAAIERQELLPGDLEGDGHDRSRFFAVYLDSLFSIAADLSDFGVLEDGGVEFGRLLGLRIEPQAGRDPMCCHRHDLLLSRLLV